MKLTDSGSQRKGGYKGTFQVKLEKVSAELVACLEDLITEVVDKLQ